MLPDRVGQLALVVGDPAPLRTHKLDGAARQPDLLHAGLQVDAGPACKPGEGVGNPPIPIRERQHGCAYLWMVTDPARGDSTSDIEVIQRLVSIAMQ